MKYIKRHHKDGYLLSYADPSAGHADDYKAANWRQDGRTDDEPEKARDATLRRANRGRSTDAREHAAGCGEEKTKGPNGASRWHP